MIPLPRLNQPTDFALQNSIDVVRLNVKEERAWRPLSKRVFTKVNFVVYICPILLLVSEEPVTSYAMLVSKLLEAGSADIHTEASAED